MILSIRFLLVISNILGFASARICKGQLVAKVCLPARYTEILRLNVSSCTSLIKIQVSPTVPVNSRRVIVYVVNKSENVNVLDTNRQGTNIRIPLTYECIVRCTNNDQRFWIYSGLIQTHMHDDLLGADFYLEGVCFRRALDLHPRKYLKLRASFKAMGTRNLKSGPRQQKKKAFVPRYSKSLSDTKGKTITFYRVNLTDQTNNSFTRYNVAFGAKETRDVWNNGSANMEVIRPDIHLIRKRRAKGIPLCDPSNKNCPSIKSAETTSPYMPTDTETAISHIEATIQSNNGSDETASILLSEMQKAHTMPDSRAVTTTTPNVLGFCLVGLLDVLYLF